jgi:hypothetical protein
MKGGTEHSQVKVNFSAEFGEDFLSLVLWTLFSQGVKLTPLRGLKCGASVLILRYQMTGFSRHSLVKTTKAFV